MVAITGHIDSRVTDVMDATHDAPGANDDASGTAAVLESARVLSKHKFAATIVYGVLSGEEQGLYGGKVLADYAKAQGWRVEADLNNDIVGNSHGQDGVNDNGVVRVFSEGTKALETPEQAAKRRYNGGELDSPSRNLARFVAGLADRHLVNFRVNMVYRTDRYGRGGDQVEFLEHGFPALRFTEPHEDYRNEHQDLRTENGVRYGDTIDRVDFDYLAQVTRLNAITLAALANAPAPVQGVDDRRRGHHRHRDEVDAAARRRAVPRLVARHHRAAMAAQPQLRGGRRSGPRGAEERRPRRLLLRRVGGLGRRLGVAGQLPGRRGSF